MRMNAAMFSVRSNRTTPIVRGRSCSRSGCLFLRMRRGLPAMANKPSAEEIERVLSSPPANRTELKRAIRVLLGVTPASAPLIEGHHSPFDYLAHTFFMDRRRWRRLRVQSVAVGAFRGGGIALFGRIAAAARRSMQPSRRRSICFTSRAWRSSSSRVRASNLHGCSRTSRSFLQQIGRAHV